MRIIYNVKTRYVIRMRFGKKFLTFLTNLVLEAKASICSTIYFYIAVSFLAFVVVVIM